MLWYLQFFNILVLFRSALREREGTIMERIFHTNIFDKPMSLDISVSIK